MRIKSSALIALAGVVLASAMPASGATTLERIKETGHIRLGYVPDAKPFTATDEQKKRGCVLFVHSPDRDMQINTVPGEQELKISAIDGLKSLRVTTKVCLREMNRTSWRKTWRN